MAKAQALRPNTAAEIVDNFGRNICEIADKEMPSLHFSGKYMIRQMLTSGGVKKLELEIKDAQVVAVRFSATSEHGMKWSEKVYADKDGALVYKQKSNDPLRGVNGSVKSKIGAKDLAGTVMWRQTGIDVTAAEQGREPRESSAPVVIASRDLAKRYVDLVNLQRLTGIPDKGTCILPEDKTVTVRVGPRRTKSKEYPTAKFY